VAAKAPVISSTQRPAAASFAPALVARAIVALLVVGSSTLSAGQVGQPDGTSFRQARVLISTAVGTKPVVDALTARALDLLVSDPSSRLSLEQGLDQLRYLSDVAAGQPLHPMP
jgi:hypothetical protein